MHIKKQKSGAGGLKSRFLRDRIYEQVLTIKQPEIYLIFTA
jgi:hypothetical protein